MMFKTHLNFVRKPEIVLIHGLNNNKSSFYPFKKELEKRGFVVHLFSLPGHKEIDHSISTEYAIESFSKQFEKIDKRKRIVCIGFSQGGLMLQLLPEQIKKQILLAPALAIQRSFILEKILYVLPNNLPLISLTPKELRQFEWLSVSYFDLLFKEINKFKEESTIQSNIPTMVLVDPKDELIDVSALKIFCENQKNWIFSIVNRPDMGFIHLGQYHVIFHPKYFKKTQWKSIMDQITGFAVS